MGVRNATARPWGFLLVLSGTASLTNCSGDNFGVSIPTKSSAGESGVLAGAAADEADALGGGPSEREKEDGGSNGFHDGGEPPVAAGGADGREAPLTVVSVTPLDRAVGVQREQSVEVSFSASLDTDTVTSETFSVIGPAGPVPGKLSVDGDRAAFTPTAPWALLADYSIELSGAITGTDGTAIDDSHLYSFQTRDGVFGKPKRLHTANVEFDIAASRSGYVALHWRTNASPRAAQAIVYDPTTSLWGPVTNLGSSAVNDYDYPCLGFNERGQAFAAVHGTSGLEWRRYADGHWGASKTATGRARATCALGDDGTALVSWEETVGSDVTAFAASLSPQNSWAATTTLELNAGARGVWRLDGGFIAVVQREGNAGAYSRSFDPKTGLGEPKFITADTINVFRFETFDATALLSWTNNNRLKATLFDGNEWRTTDLGPATQATGVSAGPSGHLVTWFNQESEYAARYDDSTGWGEPIKLGFATGVPYPRGASIDSVGNALAVWPRGANIVWRRALHGSHAWEDEEQIEDQDPSLLYAVVDSGGTVTLAWSNTLGIWASRFE